MKVEQLMTRNVKTCLPTDSLNAPSQIMWECDVGCVPVLDDGGQLVGIITDRDIAMAAFMKGRILGAIAVESVMAKQLHTCTPEDTIGSVETHMQEHQVRRFPVLDAAGALVGLVSMNDIALEAAREKGMRRPEVSLDDLALTLAGVCQHRAAEALTHA